MSGEWEWGKCEYCGFEGQINRAYFEYDIVCECHNNNHFEMVYHCDECEPKDPGIRELKLNNETKHKI